jgi:hypothetical protein
VLVSSSVVTWGFVSPVFPVFQTHVVCMRVCLFRKDKPCANMQLLHNLVTSGVRLPFLVLTCLVLLNSSHHIFAHSDSLHSSPSSSSSSVSSPTSFAAREYNFLFLFTCSKNPSFAGTSPSFGPRALAVLRLLRLHQTLLTKFSHNVYSAPHCAHSPSRTAAIAFSDSTRSHTFSSPSFAL